MTRLNEAAKGSPIELPNRSLFGSKMISSICRVMCWWGWGLTLLKHFHPRVSTGVTSHLVTLHHTQAVGVLGYTRIEVYTRARSGPYVLSLSRSGMLCQIECCYSDDRARS